MTDESGVFRDAMRVLHLDLLVGEDEEEDEDVDEDDDSSDELLLSN